MNVKLEKFARAGGEARFTPAELADPELKAALRRSLEELVKGNHAIGTDKTLTADRRRGNFSVIHYLTCRVCARAAEKERENGSPS